MEVIYSNRYNDKIKFNQIDDKTVEMTGYNPNWLRMSYANDFSEAYEIYCMGNDNPLSFIEFVSEVEKSEDFEFYRKHIKSDFNLIDMVDPSGGPYIELNSNLKIYFKDSIDRIISDIKVETEKIIFTLEDN